MIILGAALATPAIALPGFPLPLALCLSCRLLLPPPPTSPLPLPAPPSPLPGRATQGSLPSHGGALLCGGAGAGVPIHAGTVVPFFSPGLGSTESVGPAEPPRRAPCLGAREPSGTPACWRARWDLVNGAGGGGTRVCARGARRAGVLVPGGSGRGLSASGGRSPSSPFPRGASPALSPPHPAAASASGGTKLERGSSPPPRLPEPQVPPGRVAGGGG